MIIDTNVYLSRWPFRRLPHDETSQLVTKLRKMKVSQAWVGSFDGLLHRDVASVNERLIAECQRYPEMLIPFGTINPMLPDWEEDLRRCDEVHKMPGIRLHPNYHGYKLDAPEFEQLLKLALERNLIVQLAVKMEDERTQHPLVTVPAVNTRPLVKLLEKYASLKLVVLNGLRTVRGDALTQLAKNELVYFEIAMQESVAGVERLLKQVPLKQVLFGSYFPFFVFESARLKLQESELGEHRRKAIQTENAHQLLEQSNRT